MDKKEMKQTLIKITDDHYIVVDDSEITQACYVYKNHENVHGRGIFYLPPDTDFVAFNKEAKDVNVITHSTNILTNGMGILYLSEVKELIGEVDVENKAELYVWGGVYLTEQEKQQTEIAYMTGYNQALEDNKEKKYTEEDVISIVEKSRATGLTAEYIIQSLQQPPTQWDVEFIDGKLKLI